MRIIVSGKTFYGACDPLATGVPREENWPEPTVRKAGRGRQFIYEGDEALAEKIASHLESLADSFSFSDDPDAKDEGRSFAYDAARIRRLIAKEN